MSPNDNTSSQYFLFLASPTSTFLSSQVEFRATGHKTVCQLILLSAVHRKTIPSFRNTGLFVPYYSASGLWVSDKTDTRI